LLVAGVDEAGRGPVIGPMIVAGILVRNRDVKELKQIGVVDSKKLSPLRRKELLPKILSIAKGVSIVEVSPKEIDEAVQFGGGLNELEAKNIAKVLDNLRPNVAYIDAADTCPARFEERIRKYLTCDAKLVVEHKADSNYTVVGAASIIAKVTRDIKVWELRSYGDVGSGYPQDQKTLNFLRKWVQENGCLPPFTRCSWKTAKKILEEARQRKLT